MLSESAILDIEPSYVKVDSVFTVEKRINVKLLTEEETITALEMTDDRNLTSHTYHEEAAEEIYRKIKGYSKLMDKVYQNLIEA